MNIYEAIKTRKTVRQFQDRPVPQDIIEKILEAGLQAPTNDHMRDWEFVLVNDRQAREKLLRINLPQTKNAIDAFLDQRGITEDIRREMYQYSLPLQTSMLFTAGCLILPFFKVKTPLLNPKSINNLNHFASMWCCIENMLLAAAAEGIFGVTRIPLPAETAHIATVVGHPQDYVMPCYLALGYPAENTKKIRQHEISLQDRIHNITW